MNKWSTKKLLIVVFSIIIGGIILDQVSKIYFESIKSALPIYFFADVGFVWTENFGGAWSVLSGKTVFFFIITVIGLPLFGILLYFSRKKSVIGIIGFAAAISGTIGNAIDRLTRGVEFYSGGVRDFLSVGSWFPVFNIADCLLTCGIACVILAMIFFDDDALLKTHKKLKAEENGQSENDKT